MPNELSIFARIASGRSTRCPLSADVGLICPDSSMARRALLETAFSVPLRLRRQRTGRPSAWASASFARMRSSWWPPVSVDVVPPPAKGGDLHGCVHCHAVHNLSRIWSHDCMQYSTESLTHEAQQKRNKFHFRDKADSALCTKKSTQQERINIIMSASCGILASFSIKLCKKENFRPHTS